MNPTADVPEPVPFHKDPRSLMQKLAAEKREWRPHQKEHDCPQVISGLVLETGTYADMNGAAKHTLRLLTDDLATEWSVIAFHNVLHGRIDRARPRVGDYALLMYGGVSSKPPRKGENPAYAYEVLVEDNPAVSRTATPQTTEERLDAIIGEPLSAEDEAATDEPPDYGDEAPWDFGSEPEAGEAA
jgi:hypothetical protein